MSVNIFDSGSVAYKAVSQSEADSAEIDWQLDVCKKVNISWRIVSVQASPDIWEKMKKCCKCQQPQVILNNVHGTVSGGQMLALMGERYEESPYLPVS